MAHVQSRPVKSTDTFVKDDYSIKPSSQSGPGETTPMEPFVFDV